VDGWGEDQPHVLCDGWLRKPSFDGCNLIVGKKEGCNGDTWEPSRNKIKMEGDEKGGQR